MRDPDGWSYGHTFKPPPRAGSTAAAAAAVAATRRNGSVIGAQQRDKKLVSRVRWRKWVYKSNLRSARGEDRRSAESTLSNPMFDLSYSGGRDADTENGRGTDTDKSREGKNRGGYASNSNSNSSRNSYRYSYNSSSSSSSSSHTHTSHGYAVAASSVNKSEKAHFRAQSLPPGFKLAHQTNSNNTFYNHNSTSIPLTLGRNTPSLLNRRVGFAERAGQTKSNESLVLRRLLESRQRNEAARMQNGTEGLLIGCSSAASSFTQSSLIWGIGGMGGDGGGSRRRGDKHILGASFSSNEQIEFFTDSEELNEDGSNSSKSDGFSRSSSSSKKKKGAEEKKEEEDAAVMRYRVRGLKERDRRIDGNLVSGD